MNHSVKRSILFFFVCIITGTYSNANISKKPWTFLVYVAADNNLEPYVILDQKEMEKVGSNNFINIVMYVCSHKSGERKVARKLFISKNNSVEVGIQPNMDSGSEDTLINACSWALESYPSDNFALILWDHGAGWRTCRTNCAPRGVCFDDTTGNYLTDIKLINALQTVVHNYRDGKKIELVGCDACLMANIEVAYALKSYVNYFICSEETIPGEGWPYHFILRPFVGAALDQKTFAQWIVSAYGRYYRDTNIHDYTLSALNLAQLDPLIEHINTLAKMLLKLLGNNNTTKIKDAIAFSSNNKHCTHFNDPTYIDLYHFYTNLINNVGNTKLSIDEQITLKNLLHQGQELINNFVIRHVQGSAHAQASGLSIYFPQSNLDAAYFDLYWSKYTQWPSFLSAYVN